jgi:hypothetical protein
MTIADTAASKASSLPAAASRRDRASVGCDRSRRSARAGASAYTTGRVTVRGHISTATGGVAGASNGQIA